MEENTQQLKIIKTEILNKKNPLDASDPLVMIALAQSGAKPGATLPAWFNTKELRYIKVLLERVGLPYKAHIFKPPNYPKKVWIVDIAKDESCLEKFQKNEISAGDFYGYPACCQTAYYKPTMKRRFTCPYSLIFIGLVPCKKHCSEAKRLAEKYDKVITNILPEERLVAFKKRFT